MNFKITSSEIVSILSPTDINPRNSEGDFLTLRDGTIMFAYSRYTGGENDHSPCDVAAVFSYDGDNSFDVQPVILVKASQHGVRNIMSVSLTRMANGDMGLFYLVKNDKTGTSSYVLRRSSDDGKTFGEPLECIPQGFPGYYVVNNCRVLRTSSGRLFIPAAFHRTGIGDDGDIRSEGYAVSHIFYSDDDGYTWKESGQALTLGGQCETGTGLQEPGLIELPGGVLYAYFRTDRMYQYESVSLNGGKSWFSPQASRFTSPASPMKIAVNPYSGLYYAVWNPVPNYNGRKADAERWITAGRTPLVMSCSDNGVDYCEYAVIEDDQERGFCYPAIHFPDANTALLSYCSGGAEDGVCLSRTTIRKITFDT